MAFSLPLIRVTLRSMGSYTQARSLVEEGVHSIQTLQKAYPVVVLKKKNKAKKDNKAAFSGLVQLQHHHHHQRVGSSKLQKRTATAVAAAAYGINSWSVRDISDMATKAGRGMRAVRVHEFGGPEVLKVEKDVPVAMPSPSQVLVRVMYAGVNPVETYIRQGQYARLPELPYSPGHDAAGVIEAVGQGVKGSLKVGQRVFITGKNNGAYQGYSLAEESHVFPLHERLSFAQGASLGTPYFTAYKALVMGGNLMAGETVLIHGASGAVGTAAIQIAKSLGATVVGTAGTEEGLDVVRKCGAHHVFNHRDEGYQQKMVEQAGGKFDVILENLANVNLGSDMEMIKAGSRIMIVGCRGTANINPRLLMAPEAMIKGVALGASTNQEYARMGAAIVAGVEAGWVNPVIDKEYMMEDVQEVHKDIINSKGAKGKLVLKIDG